LAGAMLVGLAAGVLGAAAALTVEHARMRPDVAIALVVGFPAVVGLLVVLLSRRRWLTTLGLSVLAVAPGWFGVLAVIEVVTRG
jgi:Putative holin